MRTGFLTALLFALPLMTAHAEPVIDGVGAGDPTEDSAVIWTRATDNDGPANLRAQLSTDPGFASITREVTLRTVAEDDYTAKVRLEGLQSGTRYFYRLCAQACDPASVGRFNTAPAPDYKGRLRFGFTGDADGRFRPYPASADIPTRDLDFFVFLGDTMYGTRSTGSPATLQLMTRGGTADAAKGLADYYRKYRENILGVTAEGNATRTGQQGLRAMRQATGHYTVGDNHEYGNRDLQAGGAPPYARGFNTEPDFDANDLKVHNNATLSFRVLEKAFFAYHPMRTSIAGTPESGLKPVGPIVDLPNESRMHGTPRNWFVQQWGANAIYIQTDTRTYRDARLGAPGGGEDTGPRGDNPRRTMLGRPQLEWLKATLLAAQQGGTPWKFVVTSSPIDQVGMGIPVPGSQWPMPGTQNQDGKSWDGGYRAERNELLGFIAEKEIRNVVFLTTDDHFVRVNTLQYRDRSRGQIPVPYAIQIVSGPIGAGGPDQFPGHECSVILEALGRRNEMLQRMQQPMNGLPPNYPGLLVTYRRCGSLDGPPQSSDFFIPDQFVYTTLQVDPDATLTIETFGLDAYKENTFPRSPGPVRQLMGFRITPR